MLGRLCRWLRALGIDAEFVEAGQQGQAQSQGALIQQVQEAALLQVRAAGPVCCVCGLHERVMAKRIVLLRPVLGHLRCGLRSRGVWKHTPGPGC